MLMSEQTSGARAWLSPNYLLNMTRMSWCFVLYFSPPSAVQLFYTTRNIFHLFYDVVPTYHKWVCSSYFIIYTFTFLLKKSCLLTEFVFLLWHRDNLLKFPHLAAIQHNNCMFLAHHLLTLGHQFRPHLPLKDGVAYFVDLVPGFRKLGKIYKFLLLSFLLRL